MASTRRLAAILAADVAGYSRLMGADEEGTHERLRRHLRDLVDPKIKEHRGRIVKNTGDGMLAEFSSVVDAVRCAVEMQRAMADRNAETVEDRRITFRVGINLGDVIAEEDDIYGDGVNVAARLEALAEPGASASREWYETRSETSSLTRSRTKGNRALRVSLGRCGSSRCGPKQWPKCPRLLYPLWCRGGHVLPL
jgi:class 3 adenylate cyclase